MLKIANCIWVVSQNHQHYKISDQEKTNIQKSRNLYTFFNLYLTPLWAALLQSILFLCWYWLACCLLLIKTGWHHHKFTALCVVPHLVEANKFPKTCQLLHIVQTTTSHNFESQIQIHFAIWLNTFCRLDKYKQQRATTLSHRGCISWELSVPNYLLNTITCQM